MTNAILVKTRGKIVSLSLHIYKVEDNHQGDEDAFQIIYLFDTAFHIG